MLGRQQSCRERLFAFVVVHLCELFAHQLCGLLNWTQVHAPVLTSLGVAQPNTALLVRSLDLVRGAFLRFVIHLGSPALVHV